MREIDPKAHKRLQDLADYLVNLVRESMAKDAEKESA